MQQPIHNFSAILLAYPSVLQLMPTQFSSHQFILELAYRYQDLYVDVLYSYKDTLHDGVRRPFVHIHRRLAQMLSESPLVTLIGEVQSTDIFTHENRCALWEKV
jgi:hypothetical protein